jgi:eukaryotic-like serine/threonine-protein kinase
MPSISGERWQRLSDLLGQALELTEVARVEWLAALEQQEPEMATLVAQALAARAQAGFSVFLEGPPALAAEDAAAATLIGRRVGPYVIDAELGRGGMGSVWRAHRADGRFEGTVAIKFVHAAWIGQAGEQRFRLEGNLLARLDHPNIARLLDAGILDAGQPYLVLEYVEGEPIDVYCEQRGLTVEQRVGLFLGVLAAVTHAHSHLIVHRDLKPANICVTRDAAVKLLDFGIAKLLQGEAGAAALTQSSATALTPQYAAPEQLLGQPVTTATDVYALGLVLYVLLTGAHPISAETRSSAELLRAVLTDDAPRASTSVTAGRSRRRALEGDLDNILAKALKKNPAERYVSASAFADDLKRFLGHEPVQARPDNVAYCVSKFVRRHRGSVLSALLVALGLVAATGFALVQMRDARAQRDVARSELRRAEAANDFSSLMLEEVGERGALMSREQLLERGVQLLEARGSGDSAFVADMLSQLAGRYGDMERNDMATALMKRSITLARQAGNPSLLAMMLCEGAHQEVQGDAHPDVDPWLNEAASLVSRVSEPPLRVRVTCLRAKSERAVDAGNWEEAAGYLREAHARQVAEGVRTGLDYTSMLNDLGAIYFKQGRYLESYNSTIEVGAAFDRGGRAGTTGRLIIHENAAAALIRMGEPRVALDELEAARTPVAGRLADSEVPVAMRAKLALVLRRIGRPEDARIIIAGAADKLHTGDSPRLESNALIEEGAVLADLNQLAAARQVLERAVSIMEKTARGRVDSLAQAHALLADIEVRTGQADAAQRRLQGFLSFAGYPQDRRMGILAPALASAARTKIALGDAASARSYAEDALAIAEANARSPSSSADVGEVLVILAQLRMVANESPQARPMLERAVACFSNGLGADAPQTIEARKLLLELTA